MLRAPRFPILLLLTLLAACRPESPEAGSRPTHAADSVLDDTGGPVETAAAGIELDAPRLIPGMRAQLDALAGSTPPTEADLTSYKNMAGSLIDAMLVDLNRLGSTEAGQIESMGDTVVNLLGGGTGVPDASPVDVARSTELMKRLIDRYQQAMRAARQ